MEHEVNVGVQDVAGGPLVDVDGARRPSGALTCDVAHDL